MGEPTVAGADVDDGALSRSLANPRRLLEEAELVHRVEQVSASVPPGKEMHSAPDTPSSTHACGSSIGRAAERPVVGADECRTATRMDSRSGRACGYAAGGRRAAIARGRRRPSPAGGRTRGRGGGRSSFVWGSSDMRR